MAFSQIIWHQQWKAFSNMMDSINVIRRLAIDTKDTSNDINRETK